MPVSNQILRSFQSDIQLWDPKSILHKTQAMFWVDLNANASNMYTLWHIIEEYINHVSLHTI